MDKKHLHHIWRKLPPILPWYFLIAAILAGSLSVYGLRSNNLQMIQLRNAVFAADKSGGDVETALKNLREFVYAHMNTSLDSGSSVKPPIQLKYRYDRLVAAEKARVDAANAQVYTDAQNYCQALYPASFSGGPRVPCITAYVTSHGTQAQPIPESLYKFDFVSPSWSPVLAGWSLVATALLLLLFIVRYGLERWLKTELHDQL